MKQNDNPIMLRQNTAEKIKLVASIILFISCSNSTLFTLMSALSIPNTHTESPTPFNLLVLPPMILTTLVMFVASHSLLTEKQYDTGSGISFDVLSSCARILGYLTTNCFLISIVSIIFISAISTNLNYPPTQVAINEMNTVLLFNQAITISLYLVIRYIDANTHNVNEPDFEL